LQGARLGQNLAGPESRFWLEFSTGSKPVYQGEGGLRQALGSLEGLGDMQMAPMLRSSLGAWPSHSSPHCRISPLFTHVGRTGSDQKIQVAEARAGKAAHLDNRMRTLIRRIELRPTTR
jgi:hypothetical protein